MKEHLKGNKLLFYVYSCEIQFLFKVVTDIHFIDFYASVKDFVYTFLVITSQTLKIAFDFFKKRSADSNSSVQQVERSL